MNNQLPVDLELYPKPSEDQLETATKQIQENAAHWDDPFFMDVYGYADVDEFRKVCQPFLQDDNLKNIIILGTGGSYQTMKALSLFADKKIYFLTSSRPYELAQVLVNTNPDNSIVIPISRGGKTLDVNSILALFKEYKILALSSQGPMRELVEDLNATILSVPDLSGRFAASVCSVALVPMILTGIDVETYQKGLADGYKSFKDLSNPAENPAIIYATFLDALYKQGYRNIFSMPYSKWLEGLVGLFVQEISESSGKEGNGIIGTSQPAPLCQHSVLELILGGSKNHSSPFLWTTNQEPTDIELQSFDPQLEDQTGLSVINYQLDATFQALIEQQIPAAKLTLDTVTPHSLGLMIAFIQTTVYYYCLLTDVDWASNPMVNIGKKICNDALNKKLNPTQRREAREVIAEKKFK